jgi:rare lipoprotein A
MQQTCGQRFIEFGSLLAATLLLVGCGAMRTAGNDSAVTAVPVPAAAPTAPQPAASAPADTTPHPERRAAPKPADDAAFEAGIASWYGKPFHGRRTANGEIYDMHAMTAAHKTMPLPSYARVRNPANGREVIVRVNDRGPFKPGRIIDLSRAAAQALGIDGLASVHVMRLPSDATRRDSRR